MEKQYWYAEAKTQNGRITCGHKHKSPATAYECLQKQNPNKFYNGYTKSNLDK